MAKTRSIIPAERIDRSIVLIRGQKVMLDADLARLYGVETKALVRATKRNIDRFPSDFMFQLTTAEFTDLRSQIGTSKNLKSQSGTSSRGGRRYRPYAFTEQGVAMLSSVLKSQRAVRVNVEIMRAFVRLRQVLATNAALARRLDELEAKVGRHDEQFTAVIRAIRDLMEPPPDPPRKRIGFATEAEGRVTLGR
ncbi:MAG: ORF6N domain-containing protein [Planctomycetes bacterium]|nr:ORF6N domain-containing protein [Planctomycetota bacterium]